jgi:outer membrane protein assembly factor BamB
MKLLWQKITERTATVTVFRTHVFLSNQKGLIQRIEVNDYGTEPIWQQQTNILPMKIIHYKNDLWIFGQDGNVVTLDSKTGSTQLFLHISDEPISCVANFFETHWILSNMQGDIIAYNYRTNQKSWCTRTSSKGVISSLSIVNNVLYVANQRGKLWQINPSTGEILDYHNIGIPIGSPVMQYKPNIVIWGGEGRITRYDLIRKKVKSPSTSGDCWIRCGTPWKKGYYFGDDCGNIIYRRK